MNITTQDLMRATEGMLISMLLMCYQFRHPNEKASYIVPKKIGVPRRVFDNAKADRGHLGIDALLRMGKVCDCDLAKRYIELRLQ